MTALTSNPIAVKAAAGKLIELGIKEPDNNVKLIVLARVETLHHNNRGVLDDLALEILRVLSSPDLDVRSKALSIAMKMVSSKNVEGIVMLLKRELSKTADEQYEKVRTRIPPPRTSLDRDHETDTANPDQRISTNACSVNTPMCREILRNLRERRRSAHGFHCQLQQQCRN